MDLFSTNVLAAAVGSLITPQTFLLDNFFPTIQTEQSEEIHFDIDTGKRRVAPFVSPVVAGQVVASRGFHTATFKPAYIKDKRVFDVNRPFKRAMGEQIGGALSPDNRLRAMLATELEDQIGMVTRRMELMAAQAMRTGKVIVTGDQYPTVEVDFQRDAALTVALTTTARWGESGVKPLDNLQTWSLLVTQKSGARPRTVVMDVEAWKLFAADADVQKQLDRFRGNATLEPVKTGAGGSYMGSVGDFDIYVYADWYVDPADGQEKPILPAYTVLLTSQEVQGTRAFGAIRDEAAGFQAVPYFAKSWVNEDPAVRYLLMQSAPLTVPYRVNASMGVTVR
jgi:hypothetical protein